MSKCPHCGNGFTHVSLEGVEGNIGLTRFKCVSYNCPHCDASLGVVTDPIAVRTEVVAQVIDALRNHR